MASQSTWPPSTDAVTKFPPDWIELFLGQLDQVELLYKHIDALYQKNHENFVTWFRDVRGKLVAGTERAKTSPNAVMRKLFGDPMKEAFPDFARSVSADNANFQCELVHLSPLSSDASRLGDDAGIRTHMRNILEDMGLDSRRPLQVYFRGKDATTLEPGSLLLERGGKRLKAMWLLGYMLFDMKLDASHPIVKSCTWIFQNVHVVNVGSKTDDNRAMSVLRSCALDQSFTKMSVVEAFMTFVLPQGRRGRLDGEEPSSDDLADVWKTMTLQEPKLARNICNQRDMAEFISRVHPMVKSALWKEHLRFGNAARVSSSAYGHNNGCNLLKGRTSVSVAHGADGVSQLLQFDRMLFTADSGTKVSLTMQRSLAERSIAWNTYADTFKELCAEKGVAMEDSAWRDMFFRGRLDGLLDECLKRMQGKKHWCLRGLVSELSKNYQTQLAKNMHAARPIFDVLCQGREETEQEEQRQQDEYNEWAAYKEEQARAASEKQRQQEDEATRLLQAAEARKIAELEQVREIEKYKEAMEATKNKNEKAMEAFRAQCQELVLDAKASFFETKCCIGHHRVESGNEKDSTTTKVLGMLAAAGEGAGLLGIMDAAQLTDSILKEPKEKNLDPVVDKIQHWLAISNACAAIYLQQDSNSTVELGVLTSALASHALQIKPFYCFFEGSDELHIGLFVHQANPAGSAKACLSRLAKQRFSITGLTEIDAKDRLMCVTISQATSKKTLKPWMPKERSAAACQAILEVLLPHESAETIVLDQLGEVGSFAVAGMMMGVKTVTNIKRPRVMEALNERLDAAYADIVKVPLPPEPELEGMPDPPAFLKEASAKVQEVPVSSLVAPISSAASLEVANTSAETMTFAEVVKKFLDGSDDTFSRALGESHVLVTSERYEDWKYVTKGNSEQHSTGILVSSGAELVAIIKKVSAENPSAFAAASDNANANGDTSAEPAAKKMKTD